MHPLDRCPQRPSWFAKMVRVCACACACACACTCACAAAEKTAADTLSWPFLVAIIFFSCWNCLDWSTWTVVSSVKEGVCGAAS